MDSATHATVSELRYEGLGFVRSSRHTSQTRALNSNGAARLSDIVAACGCNTSIPISSEQDRSETTSSESAISIPAICKGTSI